MISIIVAIAENNIIGGDNKLLWHISDDLKRFKEITMGKTIIMGRKTFESLPGVLPGRHHVVLTRDENFKIDSDEVTVIHNFQTVLDKYSNSDEDVFIIGGGEMYSMAFPYCQKLFLTKIKKSFKGDTYFPDIDFCHWKITYSSGENKDQKNGLEYEFINLDRIRN